MKRILLLSGLFLIFLIQLTSAQDVARKITLEEAINIALQNNYQLKQAENNLDLAEKRITSEYADFLPSFSGSLSGNRQTGKQFIEENLSFDDVTTKSMSGSIRANLTIFDGFNNILSLRIGEEDKLSSEERLKRAEETVIFNTVSQYLQVLLNVQLLDIAKENLTTSQKQLEQIIAKVDVGSLPSVDRYNQEATVANNELSVTQRESSLELNKLLLIRQLQLDPLVKYEFEIPEIDDLTVEAATSVKYDLKSLINSALMNRSDLKSELSNIKILEYQVQLSKGSLYPSLSANAGISTGYSDKYSFMGEKVDFGDQFFDQRINRSIGLSLNLPIFSNWDRMYSIQTSQINLKNAQLGLENTRLGIIQEVAQAQNDYISLAKQYEASGKVLIASEKAYEIQSERYNVGASTLIELSQAQTTYVTAQSDRTQALYNLIFQGKLLDYYLGKLTGDEIRF